MNEKHTVRKANRRRAQESERSRMKKSGMSTRLLGRLVQERAEGKRPPPPLPRKRKSGPQ